MTNILLKCKINEKYRFQIDFAKIINVDETVLSKVVRGRKELSHHEKNRWAKVLGCKVEEIFQ